MRLPSNGIGLETVPNFVPDAFSCVIGKRYSNMMASWLLTACHSRTERFHSVAATPLYLKADLAMTDRFYLWHY